MSTYITLTGARTGEAYHIKKSAVEIVSTAEAYVPGRISKLLGRKSLSEGSIVDFSSMTMRFKETYTEVVKMLR